MGSPTSNPKIDISLLPAAVVDAFADRRDLVLGQTGSGGTAVSGALNVDVHTMTTAEIKVLFGSDSDLTHRILEWIAVNEGYSPLDVIGVDAAGSAVAAAGIITFGTGPASSDGEYLISIVDERQFEVTVAVTNTEAITTIGDALVTAIGNLTDPPFSAVNAAGVVTITAKDGGTIGNAYGIKVEGVVPGVTTAITAFTGGATDPTLTTVLDNIEGIRYTGVLWPEAWNSELSIIKDELELRFNASNAIMDGTCFHGLSDTFANIKTKVATENSQTIVYMGPPKLTNTDIKGPAILRPADWVAAEFAGQRARRLTPGAPISNNIITTSGGLDAFGGPALASLPYFNTPLRRTPVTSSTNLFTSGEQRELKDDGFTTYGPNDAGNAMAMGPAVTTWTTDAGGNPNVSFHYLNYTDTGSACREIFFRVLKSVYAQSRLTEGNLVAGRSMANAESIKAQLLKIYKFLSGTEATLTQAGREAESFFNQNTTVTTNLATRLATISGPLPIVTQLGNINYSLQLSFTVGDTGTQITV